MAHSTNSTRSTSHRTIRMLTEGALMAALALILGLVKFFEMPQGGAISFEMLPLFLFCIRWGLGPGFLCCTAFSVLQVFVQGAVSWGWISILLDFVVAFSVIGITGLGKGKPGGIFWGPVLGAVARFLVHFISGVTVYRLNAPTELFGKTFAVDDAVLYSVVYNGWYMVIDLILCLVVIALLRKPLHPILTGEDIHD